MGARSLLLKAAGVAVGLTVLLGVVAGGIVATGGVAAPTVESTSYS